MDNQPLHDIEYQLLKYVEVLQVSDFGLAKLVPFGDKHYVSTRVIGTFGYFDPKYTAVPIPNFGRSVHRQFVFYLISYLSLKPTYSKSV